MIIIIIVEIRIFIRATLITADADSPDNFLQSVLIKLINSFVSTVLF